MKAEKIIETVSRDLHLINLAGKTARTVRIVGTAVGLLAAAVTVIDAVRLIKQVK